MAGRLTFAVRASVALAATVAVGVCDVGSRASPAAAAAASARADAADGRARIALGVHAEGSASERQCRRSTRTRRSRRWRRGIPRLLRSSCSSRAADGGTVPEPGRALSRAWRARCRVSELQSRDRAESARRRGVRRAGAGVARLGPSRTSRSAMPIAPSTTRHSRRSRTEHLRHVDAGARADDGRAGRLRAGEPARVRRPRTPSNNLCYVSFLDGRIDTAIETCHEGSQDRSVHDRSHEQPGARVCGCGTAGPRANSVSGCRRSRERSLQHRDCLSWRRRLSQRACRIRRGQPESTHVQPGPGACAPAPRDAGRGPCRPTQSSASMARSDNRAMVTTAESLKSFRTRHRPSQSTNRD